MLVGAHRIEIHLIENGTKFVLHNRTYTKIGESGRDTEDWTVEYRDDFTNQTYTVSPYLLVKRGNK